MIFIKVFIIFFIHFAVMEFFKSDFGQCYEV